MIKLIALIMKAMLICIVLTACSFFKPPEENWRVSAPTTLPTNWLEVSRVPWRLPEYLSPDGKWLVDQTSTAESITIKVISNENPDLILESDPISLTTGILGMGIRSWSPDSSSFVMAYSTKVQAPCYDRGIFIFQIDESGGNLETYQFEPTPLVPVCAYTAWSPDGKWLAVNFNNDEIFIVSAQGELLHEIDPELTGGGLGLDIWTGFGLIYYVRRGNSSGDWSIEFRLVDPARPEIYETLLETTEYLSIVDYDSASQKILMSRRSKYFLFDVSSKTLSILRNMQGRDESFYIPRGDNPYTALVIEESATQQDALWVYNWQTGEFTRLLQITELLGWWDDHGGFAVVTGDELSGYEIRIIRP